MDPETPAPSTTFRRSGDAGLPARGERRAAALGNRGPIRFTPSGELHPDIVEAYWRCGFYVFEACSSPTSWPTSSATSGHSRSPPAERGAKLDAREAGAGADCQGPNLLWSKPLGDPSAARSRQWPPSGEDVRARCGGDAPKEIVYLILGSLQFSEAVLRVYGHPQLLAVAAAINGPDFTPFNEALFIKEPGRGASVAWHQDGVTHWDSPEWDQASMVSTSWASCMAARQPTACGRPGSHKQARSTSGKLVAMRQRAPARRVPMICKPGDVAITNRQALHGSFATRARTGA